MPLMTRDIKGGLPEKTIPLLKVKQDTSPAIIPWPLLLLWLFILIAWSHFNGSELLQLALPDPDDYMRLTQIMDWLNGAGWYELHNYRLDPPNGMDSHWSRLPDIPVAGVILLLSPLLDNHASIVIAITLIPVLLFLALLLILWRASRTYINSDAADIAALYMMASVFMLEKLWPGKLDHHGWQLVLVCLLWSVMVYASRRQWAGRYAVMGGITMATSLWVGLETLPFVAALFALLALFWVAHRDPHITRFSRLLALSFSFSISLLLPLHQPAAEIWKAYSDTLAINWVVVAWLAAAYFSVLSTAKSWASTRQQRLWIMLVLSASCAALIAWWYPECLSGPYANMDNFLREHFLSKISEVQSAFYYFIEQPTMFILAIGYPAMMLIAQLATDRSTRADPAYQITLGLFVVAITLSLWQLRCAFFANLLALPLGAQLTTRMRQRALTSRYGAILSPASLFIVSPLIPIAFALLVMLVPEPPSANRHDTVFSEQQGYQVVDNIAAQIAQLPDFEQGEPALIAAPINLGATILARTQHQVLAAPYHRNVDGLHKHFELMLTSDSATALHLVQKNNIDFILLEENTTPITKETPTTFWDHLAHRQHPNWLAPVTIPEFPLALLYRVQLPPEPVAQLAIMNTQGETL